MDTTSLADCHDHEDLFKVMVNLTLTVNAGTEAPSCQVMEHALVAIIDKAFPGDKVLGERIFSYMMYGWTPCKETVTYDGRISCEKMYKGFFTYCKSQNVSDTRLDAEVSSVKHLEYLEPEVQVTLKGTVSRIVETIGLTKGRKHEVIPNKEITKIWEKNMKIIRDKCKSGEIVFKSKKDMKRRGPISRF